MLELGLHSCSAINWVSGLRFSISYLAGQLSCCSPLLLSPFQVRLTSKSDYRTGAIGLLGFYRFYRYRDFRPLGFYRLCYFLFQTFRFMLSLYFGLMLLSIFWMLFYIMDFSHGCWLLSICKWRFQSDLFIVTFYYVNRGVTILVLERFINRNILLCKSGYHSFFIYMSIILLMKFLENHVVIK